MLSSQPARRLAIGRLGSAKEREAPSLGERRGDVGPELAQLARAPGQETKRTNIGDRGHDAGTNDHHQVVLEREGLIHGEEAHTSAVLPRGVDALGNALALIGENFQN